MKFILFKVILSFAVIVALSLGDAQETGLVLFKNQPHSSIPWGEVNFKTFLSFDDWKNDSDDRDQNPEWEKILRERNNREIVGYFFQCSGSCRVERGRSFFRPNLKTTIFEGDEIQTIGESFAWIFLFDGTMIRLSAESSINLNELNIGVKENFLNIRVNSGNILWLSRSESLYKEVNIRETDTPFIPLNFVEARPISDNPSYDEDDLLKLVDEQKTVLRQYKRLNNLIEKNNEMTKGKLTYAFIVMPNMTMMGYGPSIEVVSLRGGKTYFKKRSADLLGLKNETNEGEVVVQVRGYENRKLMPIESDKWMEVDEDGRSLSDTKENLYGFAMGEIVTKHIPSLLVGRELLLKKYSEFAFREKYNPINLASQDGYRLWGMLKKEDGEKKDDLELRLDFLKEYFRRIETTNLLGAKHFSDRLKKRGETLKAMEYGDYFFAKALDKYYPREERKENEEDLNSTSKSLWKSMHGEK